VFCNNRLKINKNNGKAVIGFPVQNHSRKNKKKQNICTIFNKKFLFEQKNILKKLNN
jgi:hypothetical protein